MLEHKEAAAAEQAPLRRAEETVSVPAELRDELVRLREELMARAEEEAARSSRAVTVLPAGLDGTLAACGRLEAEVGALRETLGRNTSGWEAQQQEMRVGRAALSEALASAQAEAAEERRRAEQFGKQVSWATRQLAQLVEQAAARDAQLRRWEEQLALFRTGAARLLGSEISEANLVGVLGKLRVRIRELERETDCLAAARQPPPLAAGMPAGSEKQPVWRSLIDGLSDFFRASAPNSTASRMPDKAQASSIGS